MITEAKRDCTPQVLIQAPANWRRTMPRKLSSETLTDAQLEELAAIGLSDKEISNLLGISESRWKARYQSVITKGRSELRQSLRRAQIRSALSGNAAMLIWLGKVYLGQRDTSNLEINAEHRAIAITPNVLERLQTSYKLMMEQVRARGGARTRLPRARRRPPGVPRDGVRVKNTGSLLRNSDSEPSDGGEFRG